MKRIVCVLALAAFAFAQEAPKFELPPIGVKLYGFIKVDMSYDINAGATVNDDLYFYVPRVNVNREFRIAAKQSRLGLDVSNGTFIGAKIEADFSATPTSELTYAFLRLRHAYATVAITDWLTLLAGQTWYLLPMPMPATINDAAFGYQGCLWGRAPQLRLTVAPANFLKLNLAITRPSRKMIDAEATAAGLPGAQANIWFGKLLDVKDVFAFDMTVSGGYEQWITNIGGTSQTYFFDVGGSIKLVNMFTIFGQFWFGQNLYDFLGGIGQMGYGATGEVMAMGGFVDLKIDPIKELSFNLAAGIDDPLDERIVPSASAKLMNVTFMVNGTVRIFEKFSITLECDYVRTTYGLPTGAEVRDNFHVMNSYRYDF
ncbi:MAG: hypothetical protein AABZ39_07225 [Spirochaetota bacterium]